MCIRDRVKLGKVSIAVKTFGVCDFFRLTVTDWRLRRWRLWFLALMTATLATLYFCAVILTDFAEIIHGIVLERVSSESDFHFISSRTLDL